ncbi:MAG: S8 family serine peptidase, partial [Proteobacteria bacterium]|nr:S8 family serine peptidase [Pseudomonadota bacterium]
MSDWFKRVFLGIAVLGLLAAAPAQAQNGRGQGNGAGASANVVQLRPTGVVHGQYIVVLRDHVGDPRAVANALARAHGLGLGLVYSSALKGFSARIPERALAALARDPRVDYIEADQWVQAFAQTIPTGVERIFAYENLNITIDGSDDYRIDVDVAVIDTGIDLDHPDLNVVGSTNCAKGGPFGGDCKDGEGNDGNGHGTHVAGTIAAIDNGIGVVGVAPGARLWAVRVLDNNGSGWMSWIIGGIDWVTANADIIEVANMSLGCECNSTAMEQAITNSVAAGVAYAVAAGNSDKDAATFSPANHPDVITVSALADFDGLAGGLGSPTCRTDEDDTLANFSNFGNDIEIAAPGVCIFSTWKSGGYNTISGTSMASPHVAGAAALLAASGITAPANIRSTLISTGNFDWTDDSGDNVQEPLLDVSDTAI